MNEIKEIHMEDKLLSFKDNLVKTNVLPQSASELRRDIRIQGNVTIEGSVYGHSIEIDNGPVTFEKAVYTDSELHVKGSAQEKIIFRKAVASADSITAFVADGKVIFGSDVNAVHISLKNCYVGGSVFGTDVTLENCVVLGGVFATKKLTMNTVCVGTFYSPEVNMGGINELLYPTAFSVEPLACLPGTEIYNFRRVALCRLLLQQPDVLLLDEPTNHLDTESIQWLEAHLQQYKGTVIAVTHDRYFLDNVAGWILELDRGEGIPWKGNYSSWLEQKTIRLAQEEKQESKRRKTLERELEWVRMAPRARQAKQKARLGAYEKLASADVKQKEENLEIYIPNGPHLGNKVIKFNDVSKAYDGRVLFEHLNFELPPAGIVGVIGPNGAGKTTLFRLIMGIEKPDTGDIEIGETVKLAYVDQQHKSIDPEKTVYQTVAGDSEWVRMGGREINARAWISRFNFSGADQEKKCGILSGGERNRLHLALTLKDEGNVLLLDEPTNDVDVNTIRALEEGLDGFAGCAVVVSHDRWFLDRIATHILAFEGDSQVVFFDGNYSEYEENKKKRLGNVEPKRFKYKKLME